jgi:hypothetical protein
LKLGTSYISKNGQNPEQILKKPVGGLELSGVKKREYESGKSEKSIV